MTTLEKLRSAECELEDLRAERDLLRKLADAGGHAFDAIEKMHDDLAVQAKFWRQAAEHAVEGWNRLEEKYETAVQAIRDFFDDSVDSESLAERCERILENAPDEGPAPCTAQLEIDLGTGPLCVVEEEKPR